MAHSGFALRLANVSVLAVTAVTKCILPFCNFDLRELATQEMRVAS